LLCLVWSKARDKDSDYESQRKIIAQAWIDSTGAPPTKENAKIKIESFDKGRMSSQRMAFAFETNHDRPFRVVGLDGYCYDDVHECQFEQT
jgi:hypothetical protein